MMEKTPNGDDAPYWPAEHPRLLVIEEYMTDAIRERIRDGFERTFRLSLPKMIKGRPGYWVYRGSSGHAIGYVELVLPPRHVKHIQQIVGFDRSWTIVGVRTFTPAYHLYGDQSVDDLCREWVAEEGDRWWPSTP